MKLTPLICIASLAAALSQVSTVHAETLKLGYSDWPGYTVLEVAKQKGWFKDAGVDVELSWFDYLPSLDAFSAGKIDAVCVVASDALVNGANGAKSKLIALLDFSEGSDAIVGKAGINSIKDLKGQKVGVELTLVEHLLLLKALEVNGMKQSDVELINTPTNETPQTLASGKVAAVGAWYPVSGQALKQVGGSKKLFSSADAKGLIYDVLAVSPTSFAKHKEEWAKVVRIYYKCVDYLLDPKTKDDAIKIMAAKVGADVADYAANVPGTHFLTVKEAKKAFKKGEGLSSVYGSMAVANKFSLDNKVYKESQKPASYLSPGIVEDLKSFTRPPSVMAHRDWLGLKQELPAGRRLQLTLVSFLAPLLLWCAVSYVPWLWHPLVHVTAPGDVDYFTDDMEIPVADFTRELAKVKAAGGALPEGYAVNPVYLPAPHKVARAFYTAFTTEPRLPGEPWLHESLAHSISTICQGFLISSLFGVPLGILCGSYRFLSRLQEPFIEFFRYLPAPAFGALCVAILGIDDGPKVAIIFIGTFFQQVLVIGNTVRKVDPALIEAAQTLGARGWKLVRRVIIPASISDIYTDMRILLGWAWTYLIVAEVVGTMSGITYFINQQARYRNFDNVYAAIMMIGIIGFSSDLLLAWIGRIIFPWKRRSHGTRAARSLLAKLWPRKASSIPVEVEA